MILNGSGAIYVMGVIDYVDVFGAAQKRISG
jgi:hypothetical protein